MSDSAVTLTIDGREVTVPPATLIIRAAEQVGVYVPRFCDHPLLDPLGACRQCLVEVEGQRKPLTACTTPVADGMVVRTQATSDLARGAQEGVLELLLINHPLDCPMCDKGGECPLQDQALAYGPGRSRYVDPKRRFVKPVPISPLVRLDRERCVLCARCTRFASEISDDPFIELFERGALEQVAIADGEPYRSVFSGNVIQICPVGALTSSTFRFRARPFDVTSSPGVCNRCASGCAIEVQERRGELVRVMARANPGTNDEWICDKGRFAYAYAQHPDRVTEPLVRKGGSLVAVSWAEALGIVAERFASATALPVGVLGGAQLPDEDSYALSRFARSVLGTNNVDFRLDPGRWDEGPLFASLARAEGATYAHLDAARAVLVLGSDPHEESPIVYLRLRKAWRRLGTRIHEIGPVRTRLGGCGATWTPCPPEAWAGSLLGLAAALAERGDSGLDPWTRAAAADAAPDDGARSLAGALADARGAVVVLAGERLASSPGALTLAWNLAVALGGRFGWLPRKAGARGAVWAGLAPMLLPGGRAVSEAADRAAVEEVWGPSLPAETGLDARAMLERAGDLAALYLVGADPARDSSDPAAAARALETAPFVVAHDLFLTESAKRAHVVLPAASAYEREGTWTNWEGRAQLSRGAIAPAGLAQTDFEILAQLATELRRPFPHSLAAVRREMAQLAREPEPARALPIDRVGRPAPPGTDHPLALVTYPLLLDGGTMMAGAEALAETADAPFVALNPAEAAQAGLAHGDRARVRSADGEVRLPVRVTDAVAPGVAFVPARQPGSDAAAALGAARSVRVERGA